MFENYAIVIAEASDYSPSQACSSLHGEIMFLVGPMPNKQLKSQHKGKQSIHFLSTVFSPFFQKHRGSNACKSYQAQINHELINAASVYHVNSVINMENLLKQIK